MDSRATNTMKRKRRHPNNAPFGSAMTSKTQQLQRRSTIKQTSLLSFFGAKLTLTTMTTRMIGDGRKDDTDGAGSSSSSSGSLSVSPLVESVVSSGTNHRRDEFIEGTRCDDNHHQSSNSSSSTKEKNATIDAITWYCKKQVTPEKELGRYDAMDTPTKEEEEAVAIDNTAGAAAGESSAAHHQSVKEEDVAVSKDPLLLQPNQQLQQEPLSSQNNNDDRDSQQQQQQEYQQLSEYEKLRLRNIQRNTARLAALGLLHHNTIDSTNSLVSKQRQQQRRANKRKAAAAEPATSLQPPKVPTRRSTRHRKTVLPSKDDWTALPAGAKEESATTSSNAAVATEPKTATTTTSVVVEYTHSPLYHYHHSDRNIYSPTGESSEQQNSPVVVDFSQMTSLRLSRQRLLPPKGLSAIYSLDFWDTSNDNNNNSPWLVGAGKAGMISIWNVQPQPNGRSNEEEDDEDDGNKNNDHLNDDDDGISYSYVDPVLAWKAHSGRWIADAKFLVSSSVAAAAASSSKKQQKHQQYSPERLLTAGNDGTVCLWDLSKVIRGENGGAGGVPKLMTQSSKQQWHASGIFCMDVAQQHPFTNDCTAAAAATVIATGSKDKTIALSTVQDFCNGGSSSSNNNVQPLWRSHFHTAKVGCVQLQRSGGRTGSCTSTTLLASTSDDGRVAIHDYRMNGNGSSSSNVVAEMDQAHRRPHSVVWDPNHDHVLATAGLDPYIKVWDIRTLSQPLAILEGHVPLGGRPCKRIHRPTFVPRFPLKATTTIRNFSSLILTGGEGSGALSTFQMEYGATSTTSSSSSFCKTNLWSRGALPEDCGDAGCIAIQGHTVAVSGNQGEVLIMRPTSQTSIDKSH